MPDDGMGVAGPPYMARLEARFHPPDRRGGYIVVGHVTWPDGERDARIEVSPMLALAPAPATILATFRHLVRRLGSSRERLEAIRSEYWTFVEVGADRAQCPPVGRNARPA